MVVLDSNVVMAGMFSRRGASFWLLERAISGRLAIAVSVALALEYEDVMVRSSSLKLSWASRDEIEDVLNALLARARLVQPIRWRRRPLLRDPGDDLVLECALDAGAKTIATMNVRDFSEAARFGVEAIRPGDLVARLREGEKP